MNRRNCQACSTRLIKVLSILENQFSFYSKQEESWITFSSITETERGFVLYINILTSLRGSQDKLLCVVFFSVFKSLLGIERQKKLKKKITILTRKPQRHVRILIHRTWPIDCAEHLSWKSHRQNVARKISKSVGIIYKSSFCLNKTSLYTHYLTIRLWTRDLINFH